MVLEIASQFWNGWTSSRGKANFMRRYFLPVTDPKFLIMKILYSFKEFLENN